MIRICLVVINNVNMLPIYYLYSKTSLKLYRQFTKAKLKFWEKLWSSRVKYKERQVILTVHMLSEEDFWQNWLKVHNKMELPIRIITICNVKHSRTILFKFGDKFYTSLTKLVLEAKNSICSTKNINFRTAISFWFLSSLS